jgi:hypothetical protein
MEHNNFNYMMKKKIIKEDHYYQLIVKLLINIDKIIPSNINKIIIFLLLIVIRIIINITIIEQILTI